MKVSNIQVDRRVFMAGAAAATLAACANADGAVALAQRAERPHVIRHYVLATSSIEGVSEQLQDFLQIPQGIRHDMSEHLGFRNEMMKIGETMFELVQPVAPDHRLHRWLRERGGDGGYMIVLQTFDAERFRERAYGEHLRLTRDMQFRRQDMIQFDPVRFGTHFETYQYSLPNGWWGDPNGRDYQPSRVAAEITGADVAVENKLEIAAQIGRLFESPVEGDTVRFVDKRVRFVDAAPPWRGLVALDLAAINRADAGRYAEIGGVRFRLV
ncbi:MAG: hypothetical protein NVV62_07795 [Terricaulis sp.]|nr:hypothetical protein [Terricaulis sp.]